MNENSDNSNKIPETGIVEHGSDKMSRRLFKKYEDIIKENISEGRLMTQDVFKKVLQQIPGYFEKGYTENLHKLHEEYHPSITLGELAFVSAQKLADNKIIKYSLSEFLRNKIDELDKQQAQIERQHEEDPHQIKLHENIDKHIENFGRSMKNKLKQYIESTMINKSNAHLKDASTITNINVTVPPIIENIIDKPDTIPTHTKPISKDVQEKYETLLIEYINEKNQRNTNYFLILNDQILKDLQYIEDAVTHTYDYKSN